MTLREFSRTIRLRNSPQMPNGVLDFVRTGALRIHNKEVGGSWLFGFKYKEVVEEEWIGVHAGEIMKKEWRELHYTNDDYSDDCGGLC